MPVLVQNGQNLDSPRNLKTAGETAATPLIIEMFSGKSATAIPRQAALSNSYASRSTEYCGVLSRWGKHVPAVTVLRPVALGFITLPNWLWESMESSITATPSNNELAWDVISGGTGRGSPA